MKNLTVVLTAIGIVLTILGIAIKIQPALNFLGFKQVVSYITVGNTFLILALIANSLLKK